MRAIGGLVNTREKRAAGFVKALCIWTLFMLRTTYLVQQPFLTWGPRTIKTSMDRNKGVRELVWLGGGDHDFFIIISNLNLDFHSVMSPNFNKFNYLYFIHSNTRFFEGVRRFHRPSKGPWRKERVRIPVVREHGPLQLRMSLCLNVSTNVPAVCLLAASVMVQRVSEIRKWPHRNTRTKHGTCPLKWAEHLKRPRKMFLGAFAKLWKGLLASLCPSVCMELVGRLLVDSTFLLRTALVMYLSCPEIKATYLFFLSTNKAENSILRWNKFEFLTKLGIRFWDEINLNFPVFMYEVVKISDR